MYVHCEHRKVIDYYRVVQREMNKKKKEKNKECKSKGSEKKDYNRENIEPGHLRV